MRELKEPFYKISIPIIFFLCCLIMTAYTLNSPFRLFNNWSDVNGNLTLGRCILNGIVPYRDLMEQRGPLLYLLHALAALISPDNFRGVWVLELFLCLIAFYYFAKILLLYERRTALFLLPGLAYLLYSSRSFGLGGSPKEFCLPCIASSLYILIRALKEGRTLTFREYCSIGIASGAVLWMKYSMVGFYLGAVIPVLFDIIFRRKQIKKVGTLLCGVGIGVLIISLPVLIYFMANHALADLFHAYFYINLTYYPANDSLLYKLYFAVHGVLETIRQNWKFWVLILIGLIQMIRIEKKRLIIVTIIFGAALLAITVYAGGQGFVYYGFILSVFAVFGLLVMPNMKKPAECVLLLAGAVLTGMVNYKTYQKTRGDTLDNYAQYRFAQKMKPGSTLLTYYILDNGFYMASHTLPSEYYPWSLNVMTKQIWKEQDTYLLEGRTDYVVCEDKDVEAHDTAHRYQLIDEYDGYYLYEKVK